MRGPAGPEAIPPPGTTKGRRVAALRVRGGSSLLHGHVDHHVAAAESGTKLFTYRSDKADGHPAGSGNGTVRDRGGRGLMRLVAVITDSAVITRILAHRARARDHAYRSRSPPPRQHRPPTPTTAGHPHPQSRAPGLGAGGVPGDPGGSGAPPGDRRGDPGGHPAPRPVLGGTKEIPIPGRRGRRCALPRYRTTITPLMPTRPS